MFHNHPPHAPNQTRMTIQELQDSGSAFNKEKPHTYSAFSTADTLDRTKNQLGKKKSPIEIFREDLNKNEKQFSLRPTFKGLQFTPLEFDIPETFMQKQNYNLNNEANKPTVLEEEQEKKKLNWRSAEKDEINKTIRKFYTQKKDLNLEYRKGKFFNIFLNH